MQLLASFVLQDTQTVKDLTEAIELLENYAIEKAKQIVKPNDIDELKSILKSDQPKREKHHLFFEKVFSYADNQLIFHIWRLMQDFEEDPLSIWQSDIFGRSLSSIVREGIHAKLTLMPENARYKLKDTLERIINEGSGGLIAIIL